MDISQITTPHDSVKLDNVQQYQFYFDLVQQAMDCLVESTRRFHNDQISQQETEFFRMCSERLLYTLDSLELRYLHIDETTMEIDVTDSGFPNSSALRFVANEISYLEKGDAKDIPEVKELVDGLVDTLMVKKERIGKEEIAQTAFSLFHKTTDKEKLFQAFVFGAVRPSELRDYDFVVYWMNYDILLNRPFVSIMYFDIEAVNTGQKKYEELEIIAAIKKTIPTSPVQSVIYEIDKNLDGLIPKLFKRVDIGPLACIFSRDERKISNALRTGIKAKDLSIDSFALEILVEQVISKGVLETGSRFSFIKKKQIQNWSDSEEFSFLMAPHKVIQFLHNFDVNMLKDLAKHPIDVEPKKQKEY